MDSSYSEKGEKARLISPVFRKASGKSCNLRLFVYMYGKDMGSLNIYLRTSASMQYVLFTRSKEFGDFWERLDIVVNTLGLDTNPFQIVIEGVVGSGNLGDIALDDISFTPGCVIDNTTILPTDTTTKPETTTSSCSGGFQCKSDNKCLPANKVCNFVADCSDKSDEAECGKNLRFFILI